MTRQLRINTLVRNKVAKYRKQKGWTRHKLQSLAERVHPYIEQLEKQNHQPTVPHIIKLCALLDVEPEDLFYFDFRSLKKKIEREKKRIAKKLAKLS